MIKLNPCPNCKAPAILKRYQLHHNSRVIDCSACGFHLWVDASEGEDKLVKEWNKYK